jgi:hypothetical protein
MATKAELISDVILQVYEGAPSDDANLEADQVAFWLTYYLNSLVATELNEKLKRGEMFPSVYKKRASCEVLAVEASDCNDVCQTRVYATLDEEVLTVNKDAGVIRITTDEGDVVLKASVENIDILRYMPWAKPSSENLVYLREGSKIYIEGMKAVDVPFNEINVDYIPKQDLTTMGDTDAVLVSDLVLPELIAQVVRCAKLEIYGSQQDVTNDGVDNSAPTYHEQIANPTE